MNLTPLIDIMFNLVLFFMLTTSFVKQDALDIFVNDTSNPEILPTESTYFNSSPPIIVALKGNEIFYNSSAISPEKLENNLKEQIGVNNKQPVKIITQKGVSVQSLVNAIDIAKASGTVNISIDDSKDYGATITTQGIIPTNLPELPDLQSTKGSESENGPGGFDFNKLESEFAP